MSSACPASKILCADTLSQFNNSLALQLVPGLRFGLFETPCALLDTFKKWPASLNCPSNQYHFPCAIQITSTFLPVYFIQRHPPPLSPLYGLLAVFVSWNKSSSLGSPEPMAGRAAWCANHRLLCVCNHNGELISRVKRYVFTSLIDLCPAEHHFPPPEGKFLIHPSANDKVITPVRDICLVRCEMRPHTLLTISQPGRSVSVIACLTLSWAHSLTRPFICLPTVPPCNCIMYSAVFVSQNKISSLGFPWANG